MSEHRQPECQHVHADERTPSHTAGGVKKVHSLKRGALFMRGMAESRGTIGVRVVRSRLGYSNTRWDETNKQNLGVNDKESEGRTPGPCLDHPKSQL